MTWKAITLPPTIQYMKHCVQSAIEELEFGNAFTGKQGPVEASSGEEPMSNNFKYDENTQGKGRAQAWGCR